QVAQSALAALGQADFLPIRRQIGHHLAAVEVGEHGADRDVDDQILAALAVALRAATVFALLRLEDALEAKLDQGVDVAVGHRIHAAAAPAVAAVRPAPGGELFTAKRGAAGAAPPGRRH